MTDFSDIPINILAALLTRETFINLRSSLWRFKEKDDELFNKNVHISFTGAFFIIAPMHLGVRIALSKDDYPALYDKRRKNLDRYIEKAALDAIKKEKTARESQTLGKTEGQSYYVLRNDDDHVIKRNKNIFEVHACLKQIPNILAKSGILDAYEEIWDEWSKFELSARHAPSYELYKQVEISKEHISAVLYATGTLFEDHSDPIYAVDAWFKRVIDDLPLYLPELRVNSLRYEDEVADICKLDFASLRKWLKQRLKDNPGPNPEESQELKDLKNFSDVQRSYIFCGRVWKRYKAKFLGEIQANKSKRTRGSLKIADAFESAKDSGWPSDAKQAFIKHAKEGIKRSKVWSEWVHGNKGMKIPLKKILP